MVRLKQITCTVEFGSEHVTLGEHKVRYDDGYVRAYLAVPSDDVPFRIRVRTEGCIESGIAVFVFIDGEYQCNRNRLTSVIEGPCVKRTECLGEFVLRQKEEKASTGMFASYEWRFVDLKPGGGKLEVVVLRCTERQTGDDAKRTPCSHNGNGTTKYKWIQPYWVDWNKRLARPSDAPEVHSQKSEYTHLTRQPVYMDSMQSPYAVFDFRYASREILEDQLKRRIVSPYTAVATRQAEERAIMTLPKRELVRKLLSTCDDRSQSERDGVTSSSKNFNPGKKEEEHPGPQAKPSSSNTARGHKSVTSVKSTEGKSADGRHGVAALVGEVGRDVKEGRPDASPDAKKVGTPSEQPTKGDKPKEDTVKAKSYKINANKVHDETASVAITLEHFRGDKLHANF